MNKETYRKARRLVHNQAPCIDWDHGRVRCANCAHFRPDPMGGGGIGDCTIDAKASRPPAPLLYPRALRRCKEYKAARTSNG